MSELLSVKLEDLYCSDIYLREQDVERSVAAIQHGVPGSCSPIKVYHYPEFDGFIIWEGAAQAFAANLLGLKALAAELVLPGTDGEERVLNGFREALARGIRGVRDIRPFNLLDENAWKERRLI
ncbi:MAG: hypothetical protein V1816_26955 [Pseudomonadota bacterium]